MLNRLITNIGLRLSRKPLEWMSWWRGIKWGDFIEISPPLNEEYSLWQCDESQLENLRLCGLTPDELKEEITSYWKNPFWRRCLLSFFTDIDNKLVIWSYYKRCLSFRIIHNENPALIVNDAEPQWINHLINQLNQDTYIVENYLEKYASNTKWVEKNLDLLLIKHENKRQRIFVKLINKYLKILPNGYDQESIRKKLNEEYQGIEKMFRNYIKNSCQENIIQQESNLPIEANLNQDLVYVGPAMVTKKQENAYFDTNLSCSMSSINEWLTLQRQTIKEMLKEEDPSYEVIQSVLEESLNRLQLFIDSQLKNYDQKISDVIHRRVHYKEALDQAEFLKHQLLQFFRGNSLLFHPDKSHGNENLKVIQTQLFKEFQHLAESSLERLGKSLIKLKLFIPKQKVKLDNILDEVERDRKKFREWMNQKLANLEAEHSQMRERQARMKEEINALKTQLSTLKQRDAHRFFSEEKQQMPASNYSALLP